MEFGLYTGIGRMVSPCFCTLTLSTYRYSTVSAEPEEGRGRDEDIAGQEERVAQEDYVVQALRQLPRHTTQSYDGWNYDHIRALDKEQARWLVGMVLDEEQEPEIEPDPCGQHRDEDDAHHRQHVAGDRHASAAHHVDDRSGHQHRQQQGNR